MEHWCLIHRKMSKDILMIYLKIIVFGSIIFHLHELESCATSSKHAKEFFPTFPDWENNGHYYFIVFILLQMYG